MADFIERHYQAIVAIVLLIVGLLSLQLPRLQIDSSFEGWVHSQGKLHQTYTRFTEQFGADDKLLIVFKTHDLMASDTPADPDSEASESHLDRYLDFVTGLNALPAVIHVIDPVAIYLDNSDLDEGLGLMLKNEAAIAQMRKRLSQSLPGDWGLLAAKDLQTLGLLVGLDPTQRQTYPTIVEQIRNAFNKVGIPYHLAGIPYFSATLAEVMNQDLTLIVSLLITVALAVLFFFLRAPWLVLSIMVGISVSLTSVLGLGLLMGIQLTLLALILFPLLFCVGLTTAIHLFSRRERAEWVPEYAYAQVLKPATIAMVTTATGAAAFLFAPQPAIKDMGILLPLGIVLTYLSLMLFTPALFRWITGGWQLPPINHIQNNPLSKKVQKSISLTLILAALGSALTVSNIKINPDAIFFFQQESELVHSYQQIEDQLVGLMTVELMLTTPPGSSVLGTKQRADIESFLKSIDEMPTLTAKVSGLELPTFLTENRQAMRISLHYRNLANHDFNQIRKELLQHWKAASHNSELQLAITGQLPLILMGQDQLLKSQAKVFLWIFLLVSLLLFTLLRSGQILLLALLANFIPLLIAAGTMVLLGISINSINLFVASVLLGVIVDDTIHLLHAYHKTGEMSIALTQVRPALWITTVTITLAFATLWASQIVPVVQFGLLSVVAVISAYLCDTCLLPALAPTKRAKT